MQPNEFTYLDAFVATRWNEFNQHHAACDPVILAIRNDDLLNAIVYRIDDERKAQSSIYEVAFFKKNANGLYEETYRYNLSALYSRCCNAPTSPQSIRQLGDETLHHEAKTITDFSKQRAALLQQVAILKHTLASTGGVGIAANQCAEIKDPLKLIAVGVDYKNPEHVIKALSRYPNTLFPPLQICSNPIATHISKEQTLFAEGCLSVHGRWRGLVKRPQSVTVRYEDIEGLVHEQQWNGNDARVMLHELDHIQNGKVYIQRIIEELTDEQRQVLLNLIQTITPDSMTHNPFNELKIVFERNQNGKICFDEDEIKKFLQEMDAATLRAMRDAILSF